MMQDQLVAEGIGSEEYLLTRLQAGIPYSLFQDIQEKLVEEVLKKNVTDTSQTVDVVELVSLHTLQDSTSSFQC
jgi:hypothetical protein